MTGPGTTPWEPAPIRTERLVLRASAARDRAAFIELFASPAVGTYIGGHRPRTDLERTVPQVPGQRPGLFVVDLNGAMIGMVTLDPREADRPPGSARPEDGEAVVPGELARSAAAETELGYLFLPGAWGHGYATEACVAALHWFTGTRPGEPVVLRTQVANERAMRLAAKLGFAEEKRFEEYGAEQWLGVWEPVPPSG